MSPQVVELEEYRSAEVELTFGAERRLQFQAGNRLVTAPGSAPGRYVVTATSHVGAIVTPDVHVVIRPKVLTSSLLFMMGVAPVDLDHATADLLDTQDLAAALATFFAVQLEILIRRGVVRGYLPTEERLMTVRGRIDLPTQVSRGGLAVPVACRFDDYTADVRLNRRVRAAALRLVRMPGVDPAVARRIGQALGRGFEEIGDLRAGDLRPTENFTRLDEHYRHLDVLTQLVLDNAGFESRTGTSSVNAFTVNMNTVFEAFVARELHRHLRGHLGVIEQRRSFLDHDSRVPIEPDLVFTAPARGIVYVADSKYKLTSTGLGRQSDYYQLLAYCTALELPEGVLIYCRTDGDAIPAEVVVGSPRLSLRTEAVSLRGRPHDIRLELAQLAERIRARSRQILEMTNL